MGYVPEKIKQKRSLWFKKEIARDFDAFAAECLKRGLPIEPGDLLNAALALWLEQSEKTRLHYVSVAQNYGLHRAMAQAGMNAAAEAVEDDAKAQRDAEFAQKAKQGIRSGRKAN